MSIKDVIMMIASLVGMYVALSGLKTWKKQLKWKENHQLAKSILVCLNQYHEAINMVRNPLVQYRSFDDLSEAEKNVTSKKTFEFKEHRNVYISRFSQVEKYKNELNSLMIEADVIWGDNVKKSIFKLYQLEVKLVFAVRQYLSSMDPNRHPMIKKNEAEKTIESQNVIFRNIEEDKFDSEFIEIKEELFSYLKSKI